jgi:hypothetical protein
MFTLASCLALLLLLLLLLRVRTSAVHRRYRSMFTHCLMSCFAGGRLQWDVGPYKGVTVISAIFRQGLMIPRGGELKRHPRCFEDEKRVDT